MCNKWLKGENETTSRSEIEKESKNQKVNVERD